MQSDNVKIIFQDIDGCLNPADGEDFSVIAGKPVSDKQAEMLDNINQAVDASPVQHFILNSGRPMSMVHPILKHLTSTKARYLLLEHACVLYDRKKSTYLDGARLAGQLGLDALADRYRQVDSIRRLFDWYRAHGQRTLEAHYGTDLPALEKVGNLSFCIPEHIDGDEILQRIEALAREQLDSADAARLQFLRSDRYIDILPGIHKLDGVHLLSAHLGVDLGHALAVGDFLNDLPVFEKFHRVMCPANAHPRIQELTRSKGKRGHVSTKSYGEAVLELLRQMR